MNRHEYDAIDKIELLKLILADPEAQAGMIGFIGRHGSAWNKRDLNEILEIERGEKFCEVPTLKAFYIFERLRQICMDIIMEIAEQPE